jgi:hypothetical protein
MKYVDLDATIGQIEGVISPHRYLEILPELADDLPTGARAFATDADHYDFTGKRCVKDLTLEQVHLDDLDGSKLELHFRHNCWKHDEDLVIGYQGVSAFTTETNSGPDWTQLGQLVLDELLPHQHGCSHEFEFWSRTLNIVCRDLTATWVHADCPDNITPVRSD